MILWALRKLRAMENKTHRDRYLDILMQRQSDRKRGRNTERNTYKNEWINRKIGTNKNLKLFFGIFVQLYKVQRIKINNINNSCTDA